MFLLLATVPVRAATDVRYLLVREDTPSAKALAEIVVRELGRMGWSGEESVLIPDRSQSSSNRDNEQIIVALGPRALQSAARRAGNRPMVGALVSRTGLDEIGWSGGERWSVIILDQPSERWANLVSAAFPKGVRIGVIAGPGMQKRLKGFEHAFAERRSGLVIEPISFSEDVVPGVQKLMSRIDVLLALPDPVAHNRVTVQPLLMTTYRGGIPVIGYSESYLQAGCAVALYSTIPQIAEQVLESLKQTIEGRTVPSMQAPRYFSVGVNNAVARSMGLSALSGRELEERLQDANQ